MKLAVSDYDGTLYFAAREDTISTADCDAIAAWQRENKFVLATGRDYRFLQNVLPANVHPDAYVCLTGAIAYDASGKLIYQRAIENACLRQLLTLKCLSKSAHIAYFAPYSLFVEVQDEGSWFRSQKPCRYETIDRFFASCLKGICQVNLQYEDDTSAQKAADEINSLVPSVKACATGIAVDVVAALVDKASGVRELCRQLNWHLERIIAFGDGENDLPLFAAFDGFAINTAAPKIKEKARGIYDSIAACLLAQS